MKNLIRLSSRYWMFFPALALAGLAILSLKEYQKRPLSRLGEYRGYSEPIYQEWNRISQYITVRDCTDLAVDIFRPTESGNVVNDPLPVIWTYNRYHRAGIRNGRTVTLLEQQPWLDTVLQHGYVIAVVDIRGSGASYGTRQEVFAQEEIWDAYDITEWFAAQPWSNGRIGLFGRSYMGINQYLAASRTPPHLVAIFPEMAMFDFYSFTYPGGVFHHDYTKNWSQRVKNLDTTIPNSPVDSDTNGVMLTNAVNDHQANRDIFEMFARLIYRNSTDELTNTMPYIERSPSHYLNQIKKSGVAVYHLAGWYDMWPRDAFIWFNNLNNPQKIVIGPWSHTQNTGLDLAAEHLRWYDYWLKGIDNGIMAEAPIYYYTMGAPKAKAWRSALQWPPPKAKSSCYYFNNGISGSVNSVNDRLLNAQLPVSATGQDDYIVDYTTTSSKKNRWTNGYGGAFGYPDMTANDEKGLTYTTKPLDSDIEVTGHPVIHLWVTSTAKDGDFFAYLEEVDANGFSHYITEGTLRASHQAISEPPFDYLDLPYHRSFEEDQVPLTNEPAELTFDLHPTSNIFDKGHRIRLTITCADKDNALTPELTPPPSVTIFLNSNYSSYISLPIIPVTSESTQLSGK